VAGQKQPMELLLLKGSKHFGKAEIEARIEVQVKVGNEKVSAPSYLPPELKREFTKLSKELIKANILSNLDVDALARFVMTRKMFVELTNELLTMKVTDDDYMDLLQKQDKLFKQVRSSSQDLGLTISSRCKLEVPKRETKEPDEFDKKFGDI